jgi:hypothetical protein
MARGTVTAAPDPTAPRHPSRKAGSARRHRRLAHLGDTDVIAEGIAQPEVDAIGLLGGFLGDVDTLEAQLLAAPRRIVGGEEEVAA